MIYEIDGRYQLRPLSNGLCFEIYKYKTVRDRETGDEGEKWVSMGRYASNLSYGLRLIFDDMIRNDGQTVKGLKATIEKVEEIEKRVMNCKVKK